MNKLNFINNLKGTAGQTREDFDREEHLNEVF